MRGQPNTSLFIEVYKAEMARMQHIDERHLYLEANMERLPAHMAKECVLSFLKVIKTPEWRKEYRNDDFVEVPASWWDHLKLTAKARWPRLRLNVVNRKIKTKVSVSVAIDRMCPHHSTIASDKKCERFIMAKWADFTPIFDPMELPALHDFIGAKRMEYDDPYCVEIAHDVMKAARAMLADAQRAQSLIEFMDKASETDKLAWTNPILVALWEFVNQDEWPITQTPDHYLDDWKIFGLPIKVNDRLPLGSWRIL